MSPALPLTRKANCSALKNSLNESRTKFFLFWYYTLHTFVSLKGNYTAVGSKFVLFFSSSLFFDGRSQVDNNQSKI